MICYIKGHDWLYADRAKICLRCHHGIDNFNSDEIEFALDWKPPKIITLYIGSHHERGKLFGKK